MDFCSIACLLNNEGVLPPGVLYYKRKGKDDSRRVNHQWAETTAKSIIRNEAYIGNMEQGKNGTVSYKCKKLVAKPKEEWIRVEDTHEAIMSPEVWAICVTLDVQRFQKLK